MIISYARPNITWTATGATFLTDSDRLTNGRATSATRIDCGGDSSGAVTLTANFGGSSFSPKLVGIVGTDLAVGTSITCQFIRPGDGSYGYQSKTIELVERRDGVRVAWFAYTDGLDACYAMQLSFDATSQLTSAGLELHIGEVWVGAGRELCITPDYTAQNDTHSAIEESVNGQPFRIERQSSTMHKIKIAPKTFTDMYGNALTDVAMVRQEVNEYRPCAIVPMTAEAYTGKADNDTIINHQAAFGYVRSITEIAANPAPLFSTSLDFMEVPAWI